MAFAHQRARGARGSPRQSLRNEPIRASAGGTPRHDRILALQRDAGNAAVRAAIGVARTIMQFTGTLVDDLEGVLGFEAWYALKSRLVFALADLGTLEIDINTALLEIEIERLRAETAAIEEEVDRVRDHTAGHPGPRPIERLRVLAGLARGVDDDKELTDQVFLARHPERSSEPLRPGDHDDATLVAEWQRIRRSVVRPVLASELGKLARASGRGTLPGPAAGT